MLTYCIISDLDINIFNKHCIFPFKKYFIAISLLAIVKFSKMTP